jgi:hypothetical protein
MLGVAAREEDKACVISRPAWEPPLSTCKDPAEDTAIIHSLLVVVVVIVETCLAHAALHRVPMADSILPPG